MAEEPFKPLVSSWLAKIRLAQEYKKANFQDDADEAMRFYNGPHDFLYSEQYQRKSRGFSVNGEEGDFPNPTFKMSVNRVAEMVQLFGPVLYHRNPVRQVNPRKLPLPPIEVFGNAADPMIQQMYQALLQQVMAQRGTERARAGLIEYYLNYTPNELDLKSQSRMAIDEAIIKGMGCLWTEVYHPKSGGKMVGSFYDSTDNLVVDPDMETIEAAHWISRRCVHPVWQVEREYRLPPDSIKGNLESLTRQGESSSSQDSDYYRRQGKSNDLLVYWKVYSKMGMGARLSGASLDTKDFLEQFGDNCYLVVADTVPYPLNLPLDVPMAPEEVLQRAQWPTPLLALDDTWPVTPIKFHDIPNKVWPMSHLKPAIGELKFLDWAYSFLAGKIRTTCRDFVVTMKSAGEELKRTILGGRDLSHIELESSLGKTIGEVVQFLQHPQMNGDIFRVIQAVEANFEKRTGLTELMFGMSSRQMRSAQEAELKGDQLSVRPDDMANKVEDAMTAVARKEALVAQTHLTDMDVMPMLGAVGAQMWRNLVQTDNPQAAQELDYRIEAGSARKPNKDRDAANMGQAMQQISQMLYSHAQMSGDVKPINSLLRDWAKSIDLDSDAYMLQPPPPPPMPGPPGPPQGPKGPK